MFEKDSGDRWVQVAKLSNPQSFCFASLGASLAMENDRLLIGAPTQLRDGYTYGAAYFCERTSAGSEASEGSAGWHLNDQCQQLR